LILPDCGSGFSEHDDSLALPPPDPADGGGPLRPGENFYARYARLEVERYERERAAWRKLMGLRPEGMRP
jgi:hypothetical protein